MGGMGSGGWNATRRPTTGDCIRLCVNRLNKRGALSGRWQANLAWDRGGEHVGDILVTSTDTGIKVTYHYSASGGPWVKQEEDISVVWEACRFGGRRPFFRCPRCRQRCLHLYILGRSLCRTCCGLTYPSQRQRRADRTQRRADKIRLRLGGETGWYSVPSRPKGMHHRTYRRLVKEIDAADETFSRHAFRALLPELI